MCPRVDELLGFLAGQLAPERSSAIEIHMDLCAECRATISSLVRGSLPDARFGRYRIETVIGHGGMGIVYRAFDPELARAVAIKVVKPSGNDDALRARLVREAQSLARLSHPNVCQVYDAGRDGEEVWVAMELIDGMDLRLWATSHAAAEIEAVLISAARGIAAAHAVGLIHRDVKPENVLVTHTGRTVVTDFGLARRADGSLTSMAADAVSGTPAYMAPEQLTAAAVDARVDQFAWAVMAWEMLASERPFPIEAAARLVAIRSGVAPPSRFPARWARVLPRALSSVVRDRFESMDALLEALSRPAPRRRWSRSLAVSAGIAAAGLGVVAVRAWQRDSQRTPAASGVATTLSSSLAPALPEVHAAVAPVRAAPEAPPASPRPPPRSVTAGAGSRPAALPSRAERRSIPRNPAAAGATPAAKVAEAAGSGSASPAAQSARDANLAAPLPATDGRRVVPEADRPVPAPADSDPGAARPARYAGFSRARAESILADCRFPIDPARPERALAGLGVIVDWGPVVRREEVRGQGRVIYEIQGSRDRYQIDAGGMPQVGMLEAEIGDRIVVCPNERPAIAIMNTYPSSPYRRSQQPGVYAFAPADVVPRIASDLRGLAPLHVPEGLLRRANAGIPPELARRTLLVWARPVQVTPDSWVMNGWTVDVADMRLDELAPADVRGPIWLIVDRLRVVGSPADRQVIVHGVRALRSLLR